MFEAGKCTCKCSTQDPAMLQSFVSVLSWTNTITINPALHAQACTVRTRPRRASAPPSPEAMPLCRAGVRASDGDGTVPLLSLGALCARHWREPRLNPSGMRVVTREFLHEPFYGLGELRCACCCEGCCASAGKAVERL